jgi:hypothetical protein
MRLAVKVSCAAWALFFCAASANAAPRRVLVRDVSYRWITIPSPLATPAFSPDQALHRSCRRKIRRELGPARGRHTASLRLAFAQRCVASGGKSW